MLTNKKSSLTKVKYDFLMILVDVLLFKDTDPEIKPDPG